MLSSFNGNKVPYFVLFPKEPLFPIVPCVLECTCLVHDLSPSLDKLLAHAIKGVFLEYSKL